MESPVVPGLVEAADLAMEKNDWTAVRSLLESTALKDSIEYAQLQQIHVDDNIIEMACYKGFTELISVFLNSGFPVNYVVDMLTGRRMLHLAATTGHLSLVKLLSNVGADVNCKTYHGETPISCAVGSGHFQVGKHLIIANADINACKTCNEHVEILLDAALGYYTVTEEMLQLLLVCECDKKEIFSHCLYWAVYHNNIKFVRMMLDAGAHINGVDTNIPLHSAAWNGAIPIMELLLEYGADINIKDICGLTALHTAVVSGRKQSVKFLIEHGSLRNLLTNNQETPLLLSINFRQFDIAILLINSGADLNFGLHNTVLNEAVRVSAPAHVIECLLEHGARVAACRVYYSETALQYVMYYTDYSNDMKLQIAKLLLIYGSNHYVQDYNCSTILHLACQMGDVELVEYLIDYGLNVDAKNRQGKKPIDIAHETGNHAIVNIIIEYHCNKYSI